MAIILGIETSCDETAAAICIDGKVINNEMATQNIHQWYGGVVPELASRAHQKNIVPVVDYVLKDAGITPRDLDAIAYTRGPGLLGALLIGAGFAKAMASALKVPIIPVNHLKAHVLALFIEHPKPTFPFLCLTVSGGHTQIVKVLNPIDMVILGQTKDDAAGEAFDKAAKLLQLTYPGGPIIDQLAKRGNPHAFTFGETNMPNLDYSFSGIKTSILYFLKKEAKDNPNFIKENLHDLAASIQHTLTGMLMEKLEKAALQEKIRKIAIAGGVSANSGLRNLLHKKASQHGWEPFIPPLPYCTDNAAMVAIAGHFQYEAKHFGKLSDSPMPRMPF